MKQTSHDLKLSSFFAMQEIRDEQKLLKTASSLDNFGEVMNPEDAAITAKMVHEILNLPNSNYSSVITSLKNAGGVVNFVTNNEFAPLVEILIKSVYSPANNDVYNMSMETPDKDYFIDAKDYFGDVPVGDGDGNLVARRRLDELINGSIVMMDKAWQARMKLDDDQMRKILGAVDEEDPIWLQWEAYHNLLKDVSDYQKKMNEISQKLEKERSTGRKMDKMQREQMVSDFVEFRSLKKRFQDQANKMADSLKLVRRDQNGRAQRARDGFIHFNPLSDVNAVGGSLADLQENNHSLGEIAALIPNFITKLKEYPSTDPVLLKKKQAILNFFGDPLDNPAKAEEAAMRFRSRYDTFGKLFQDFNSRAKQHGKVMLINNFENSAFCVPAGGGESGQSSSFATDGGILSKFIGVNESNLLKDLSKDEESASRTNRVILIVSDHPISGLPVSQKIEMKVAPVDGPEANIIINNLVSQVSSKARQIFEMNQGSDLVEKFPKNEDRIRESQKMMQAMAEQAATLGRVDPDIVERMKHWIIGMSLTRAIQAVRQALAAGKVLKPNPEDPHGAPEALEIDSKKVYKTLKDTVNAMQTEGTKALVAQDPSVKFEEYAYNKIGEWADHVQAVGVQASALATEKSNILASEANAAKIGSLLMNRSLNPAERGDYVAMQKRYLQEAEASRHERKRIMNTMAHLYVLYGDPGVGKSIWADALASLLDFVIQNVDIGAARNKWVGGTEELTRGLMSAMLNSQDTVFLIDEIDRQMGMSGSGEGGTAGAGQAPHETSKDQVKQFLDFFELNENQQKFYDNNIFVIMTTNFVGDIDTAMKARIPDRFRVELPTDPEAYVKMVKSYMQVEQRRAPDRPIYCEKGTTDNEECWKQTFALMNQVDWSAIAKVLVGKKISFREVKMLLRHALIANNNWNLSMGMVAQGKLQKPLGLPLTTNNMLAATDLIDEAKKSYNDNNTGIPLLMVERQKELDKMIEDKRLTLTPTQKEETYLDAQGRIQKRPVTVYTLGEEAVKLMHGDIPPKAEAEEAFEPVEEEVIDPATGKPRKQVRQLQPKSPTQQMKDLVDKGFEERSLTGTPGQPLEGRPLEKEEITEEKGGRKKKEEKDRKNKVEASSSTDYYYNHLLSKGILNEKGEIVKQAQGSPMEDSIVADGYSNDACNFGWMMILPAHLGAKPQMPKTEIEKGRKNKKGRI